MTFSSGRIRGPLASSSDHVSSSGNCSTYAESSSIATDSPLIDSGTERTSAGDSSQISSDLVESNHSGQNGISMFQGYWC